MAENQTVKPNVILKKVKLLFFLPSIVILCYSCSKKISCYSIKTVPVTFIKDGRAVTVDWKYCDTCIVGKKAEIPKQ